MIDEGADDVYNCTVASSNRTKVHWVFRGAPIPECNYNNSFGPSQNICLTDNQPCITRSVSVTEELYLVHSLILHVCGNAAANISGHYTCEVQGLDKELVKLNKLTIQQSIYIYVNVTNDANVDEVQERDQIIIPLVSASASVLIFVMSISIIIVTVKLLCYVKRPCGSHETGDDANQEMELASTLPTKKIIEEDDWEFSREKLKLLQNIGKIVTNGNQPNVYALVYIYIQVLAILVKY